MTIRKTSAGTHRHAVKGAMTPAGLLLLAALGACGKASDAPAGMTVEKVAAPADPALAAQVGEADLGVPVYPGAAARADGFSRIQSPEAVTVTAAYDSKDEVRKVAAFYRERLRAGAAGGSLMDSGDSNEVALVLMDTQTGRAVNVSVGTSEGGSRIQILSTRPKAP